MGQIQIIVTTDTQNELFEYNAAGTAESNNTASLTQAATLAPYPDLIVAGVSLEPSSGLLTGSQVVIHWQDVNMGTRAADRPWYDRIVVENTVSGEVLVSGTVGYAPTDPGNGAIAPGDSRDRIASITLPDGPRAAGLLRFTIITNVFHDIPEANSAGNAESNNTASVTQDVELATYPDLKISNLRTDPAAGLHSGDTLSLLWDDLNSGVNATSGSVGRQDRCPERDHRAEPEHCNSCLRCFGQWKWTHRAGEARTRQFTYTLPDGTDGVGQIEFIVTTDSDDTVFEYNASATGDTNNTASISRTTTLAPYPDLVVSNVTAPALTIGDPAEVTIGWTVSNPGEGGGRTADWFDDIVASPDTVPGNSDDILLARFAHSGSWIPARVTSEVRPSCFRRPCRDDSTCSCEPTLPTTCSKMVAKPTMPLRQSSPST